MLLKNLQVRVLLEKVFDGNFTLITSDRNINEAEKIKKNKKF